MAQYTQRTQPMHRAGQTEHGHGGALAYGGKPAAVAPPQQRQPPVAPYAPQPYAPAQLRLHQPGYGSAALSYRDGSYGRGGGAVGEYRRKGARMSLLGASSYLPPPAPSAHHPSPADPPPYKKVCLMPEPISIRPLHHHQQLRVDTREPVNAYNTVEVLSPNPPSEPTVEDQALRTTKDDLLQQISKVDREMALAESSLAQLKKKQGELEQSASKPAAEKEPEEKPSKHTSLSRSIYADNKKKAASAHALLDHLGSDFLYPLYNQPQDTKLYHENIKAHRTFRSKLQEHIRILKEIAEKREDALAEEYSRRAAEWARRVERIEQSQKRKAKDAKNREFFEKVFPELRKQREERERFNRLGARAKSEAELEEIADGLHEQEHEDKKMRSLTVVPPLLRDPADPTPIYIDNNRRCLDMKSEHKELQLRNIWSQTEKEIFREKYLQHPKNFGTIASFLPRKNVRECVRFYYLSKKSENYKQLLRKPRQRRSTRNPPRPVSDPDLPAGVTTRLQRSQGTSGRCADAKDLNPEEGAPPGAVNATGVVLLGDVIEAMIVAPPPVSVPLPLGPEPSCVPLPSAAPTSLPLLRPELIRTPPLPPSPPPASSAPLGSIHPLSPSPGLLINPPDSPEPTPLPLPLSVPLPPSPPAPAVIPIPAEVPELPPLPPSTTEATVTITIVTTSSPSLPPSTSPTIVATTSSSPSTTSTAATSSSPATVTVTATTVPTPSSSSSSAPPTPQPAQPPTPTQPPPTPEAAVTERIGTPSSTITATTTTVTTTSSNCAVCSMPGATRTVSRSRTIHYGLKEDAVGGRVCEACHCRCVRSRYTRCPVPTCPGPRVRAKRLRHLPPRWHDLSTELKKPLMDEFQIPGDLSKCCLACFKRITRRLDTIGGEGSEGSGGGSGKNEPTEEEAARFKSLLREHGTAWDRIAALSGRTPASLKAFYFTYRKKLSLESAIGERSSSGAGSRCSSSSESALSSGDTDTASPGSSPAPAAAQPPGPRTDAVAPRRARRDEYDSSATETADEENDAPAAKSLPLTSIGLPPTTTSASSPAPAPSPVCVTPSSTVCTAACTPVCMPACAPVSTTVTTTASTNLVQRNGPSAPQTVRDVVLNLIEFSLTRDSHPVPPSIKPHQLKVSSSTPGRETLATLTVVNSSSHGASVANAPRSPHRPTATITPISQPGEPSGKDGVVLVHIEPRQDQRHDQRTDLAADQRPDSLLDLTVKRPTDRRSDPAFPHPNKPSMYRNTSEYVFRTAQERDSPTQYNCKTKAGAVRPTPAPAGVVKNAANPKGSITLGTPVETRYEARRTPPGSITAGTPVLSHHGHPQHLAENKPRLEHYYKRRSPAYCTPAATQRTHEPAYSPTSGGGYGRTPHGIEQRQIIMADFITSQQMNSGARRDRQHERERPDRPERIERDGSPQFATHYGAYSPQRRDSVSVIQRHTPHSYPHPHPPPHHQPQHPHHPHHPQQPQHTPPGHEAFASLVNVASAATALPVPGGDQPKPDVKPQPSPQHHDVRLRDVSLSQKYHPISQYQVIDRRVKHSQYTMERDIQIAMQQRRENERAMAAMQERHAIEPHQQHQAHQQHQQHQPHQQYQPHHQPHPQHHNQQNIMHDRHHVTSGAVQEGDRRLAGAAGSYNAPAKHRAHTPHHPDQRKDTRGGNTAVAVGVGVPGGTQALTTGGGAAGAEPRSGTLTAASLIDAIITHQISQTSDQRYPTSRECENNGPTGVYPQQQQERSEPEHAHTTSIKLGVLANNIITRDFCSPTTSMLHHNSRFAVANSEPYGVPSSGTNTAVSVAVSSMGGSTVSVGGPAMSMGGSTVTVGGTSVTATGGPPDEWKRRDPPKHAPYLEPVSPPDNHQNNSADRCSGAVSGAGSGSSAGGGGARRYGSGVLTAFDYVTTRIVEVMRSDADERAKPPLAFAATPYTFPYSALNVAAATTDGVAPVSVASSSSGTSGISSAVGGVVAGAVGPEPAPLMSAQYEPLSDED